MFGERMIYKPAKEGPMRVLKQFKLVCIGLASVEGRTEVTEEDYSIVKKIALSSTPSRIETIIRLLHSTQGPLKGKELIEKTRFDYNSLVPILKDLTLLELITETRVGGGTFYELSKLCRFYIENAGVYT